MKTKSILIASALIFGAPFMYAANTDVIYNITGATAFRAAAHNAIINLLGGAGVCQYAYDGASLGAANKAIFKQVVVTNSPNPGDTVTTYVRTNQAGSTQGILDLADQVTKTNYLKTTVTMSTTGTVVSAVSPNIESAIPRFAFSDVDKLLSSRPNSTITGEGVGVVPFMFVAGESAPAGVNNMTDQIHESLWGSGELPASIFTGNSADANFTILATGRDSGSGTRAAVLSETQYGAFRSVIQFNSTYDAATTGSLTGSPFVYGSGGNGGGTSNSFVRALLVRSSNTNIYNGGKYAFVSYLTISDAVAATGYDQATGIVTPANGEGAKPMTYNGVRYSEENVNNGTYTLWSYQQLYRASNATPAENTFATNLKGAIDAILTPDIGLKTSTLNVERTGGDGGPIAPL